MLVLLGLNETQSSVLSMTEFWMTTWSERYVSQPSEFFTETSGLEDFAVSTMSLTRTSELLAIRLNHCHTALTPTLCLLMLVHLRWAG